MTDQERPDHWALLASELGAKLPPEGEGDQEQPPVQEAAREEPVSPAPEGPRYSFAQPATRKTPSDWLRLAEQLGVTVDAELISQVSDETTNTEVVGPQAPASLPPEPPTVVMEPEPVETTEDVVDVVDVFSEGDEQLGNQLVDRVDTDTVEEEERPDKKRRRRRRRRPRKPENTQGSEEIAELPVEEEPDNGGEAEDETLDIAVGGSESLIVCPMPCESTETSSRGRRRRRRRSPGKKREGEETTEAAIEQSLLSVAGEAALVPLDGADLELSHAVLGDEDDHLDETDDDDVGRPSHRGIPTWDEAVGIVITRNMEARAKNSGGQQRSRGGRGRH